jgi:hypothetical protein
MGRGLAVGKRLALRAMKNREISGCHHSRVQWWVIGAPVMKSFERTWKFKVMHGEQAGFPIEFSVSDNLRRLRG